jgi:hypothetical protein
MNKILLIQIIIFLVITLLSFILQGTPWLSIMMLLSTIVGPFMAYSYPWGIETHLSITSGFIIAAILMFYGIKYRTTNKGIMLFLLGFWLWIFIGLLFGLSTGT